MKKRVVRGLIWLAMTLTAAQLYQVSFTTSNGAYESCTRFAVDGAVTPIDFCYIFDCQSGFLGGAIQPCGDPGTTSDDFFVDCPGNNSNNNSSQTTN